MNSISLHKYVCWKTDRVSTVINKEAVSVDAPIFLATHTPFARITYIKTPAQLASTSEDELLSELSRRALADQHTFALIQGIHGSGKSHLIRWLKDRYTSENDRNGGKDVVLLIERANNTLRQTLQQILASDAFDASIFANQRERLARSADQLTEHGLEETLINNLQVAYLEDKERQRTDKEEGKKSLKPNLERHLNEFLLDSSVRNELRRVGGPVKRIARFLAAGNSRDTGDTLPAFQAQDFEFKVQFLQSLRIERARPDTVYLVEKLSNEAARVELAAYLNTLLEFAIGRTTALSSNDLKQMFNDLRSELRRQNRSLTLFVEDITAFTGLDTGLIDILITQHTGEGNAAFCRILSVVGVTDEYFNTRFPGNVRDRISHHLTLNQRESNTTTELLSSSEAVASLAARYMNAIRLDPDVLNRWYADGADPASLPSACALCPVRRECHSAFGAVALSPHDGEEAGAGLYPFNANALWSMYNNINTNVSLRTPRTLLNGILSYVLASHTSLIHDGRFPPPRAQVGSEFAAPTLLNPQQHNLFRAHGLNEPVSKRLEALVVFWGNRTLDTTQVNNRLMLSGLSKQVFDAFGLPFIVGAIATDVAPLSPAQGSDPGQVTGNSPANGGSLPPSVEKEPVKVKEDPIIRDIEDWRAGKSLQNYNILGQALARFIRDAVDWDAYDVPRALVEDRIKQARFVIEGQAGRNNTRYTFLFRRTDSLANVFYAVHALEGNVSRLPTAQLSSHLTALTVWLAGIENSLVAFVRAPQSDVDSEYNILKMQTQVVTALAVLAGKLNATNTDSPDKFARSLVAFCAQSLQWPTVTGEAEKQRCSEWFRLVRNSEVTTTQAGIRAAMLDTLNCPQGTAKSVLFVDMASLLDQVQALEKIDWRLPALNFVGEGDVWQKAVSLRGILSDNFAYVLERERAQLGDLLAQFSALSGDVNGRELDRAIKDYLGILAAANIQPPAGLNEDKKPAFVAMEQTLRFVISLVSESDLSSYAYRTSGATAYSERLRSYVKYLSDLKLFAEKRMAAWQQELDNAGDARSQLDRVRAEIESLFDSSVTALADLVFSGESA